MPPEEREREIADGSAHRLRLGRRRREVDAAIDAAAAAFVLEIRICLPRTERDVSCRRHSWLDDGGAGRHWH